MSVVTVDLCYPCVTDGFGSQYMFPPKTMLKLRLHTLHYTQHYEV